MGRLDQEISDLDADSELLPHFPAQAVLEALIRSALAPREFPKPPHVRLRGPATDEDEALLLDHGRRHLDRLGVRAHSGGSDDEDGSPGETTGVVMIGTPHGPLHRLE